MKLRTKALTGIAAAAMVVASAYVVGLLGTNAGNGFMMTI